MPHPRLVGREAELGALAAARDAAGTGRGGLVLVTGDTGAGKSRLVEEAAKRAQATGVRVLRGAGVELLGGSLPYGVLLDLLLSAGGATAGEVVTGLLASSDEQRLDTGADPGTGRVRLLAPLLDALLELTAAGPVLVVVEDLHWADASSLDVLLWLLTKLPRLPVLVVATCRTTDLGATHPLRRVLAGLDRSPGVQRLELGPLHRADVGALARQLAPGPPPDPAWVDEVHTRSGGNALFAEELLAAGSAGGLPESLHELLLVRVRPLDPAARRVLDVMSVAAGEVPEPLLADVTALDPGGLRAALRTVCDTGLVVRGAGGRGYRLRHALLGEAVEADLLDGDRRRWHAALAAALTAAPPPELAAPRRRVEIAHHLWEAGDLDPALAATREAAAALCRTPAFAESSQQLERAVALSDRLGVPAADLLPLLDQAAEAARWTGRTDLAVQHLRRAVDLSPQPDASRLERLGQALWEAGRTQQAEQAYAAAARLSRDAGGPVHARVLAEQGRQLMLAGRFGAAREVCERALDAADGDPVAAAATVTLGVSEAMSGDVERGLDRLRTARAGAADDASPELLTRAYGNSAAVLAYLGRLDESIDVSQEGLRLLARRGLDLASSGRGVLTNAVAALVWRGRWDEAAELATQVLDRPLPSRHAPFLRLALGEVAAARGDVEEAERHLAYCRERAEHLREPQLGGPTVAALAALRVWQGDTDAARTLVAEGLLALPEAEQEDLGAALCAVGLRACADAASVSGSRRIPDALREEGDALLGRAEQLCGRLHARGADLPECEVAVLLARAEHARLGGDDAAALFAEVADGWDRLQRPYPAAYARWRRAEGLLLQRRAREAEPELRESLAVATRLRSAPLAEAVTRALQSAGLEARPSVPEPRRRLPRGSDALTDRELEVLRAASRGGTNKQIGRELFISDRTVGIHLAHVMDKLGARNRLEAVQVAHRRGLLTPDPVAGP